MGRSSFFEINVNLLPDPRILSEVGRASRGARESWKSSLTWGRHRPVAVVVVVVAVAVVVAANHSILKVTTMCDDVNPKNKVVIKLS